MASHHSQEYLDNNQYTVNSILRYERIFGHNWISTGGETMAKELVMDMGLKPGQCVLDVGSGTGGSAFYLARHYGVEVVGIDISSNMLQIGQKRLANEDYHVKKRVKFELLDIMEANYDNESFDVIYSRDTILHIADKEALFNRLYKYLKPGGKLLVTDYCCGDKEHSKEFKEYVKERGYNLRTVPEYGKVIEAAGFKDVKAVDLTLTFLDVLAEELKYFIPTKESFIKDFSMKDYEEIVNGWKAKQDRCKAGDQAWGFFTAQK